MGGTSRLVATQKSKSPAVQMAKANRPQGAENAKADGGSLPAAPKAQAGADARRLGDGEQAQPLQQLDPPHRLSTPADLKPDTAHGHSPLIEWPKDAQSADPRPFKNMK